MQFEPSEYDYEFEEADNGSTAEHQPDMRTSTNDPNYPEDDKEYKKARYFGKRF